LVEIEEKVFGGEQNVFFSIRSSPLSNFSSQKIKLQLRGWGSAHSSAWLAVSFDFNKKWKCLCSTDCPSV